VAAAASGAAAGSAVRADPDASAGTLPTALRYVAGIAFSPGPTTERLLLDPRRLRHGVVAWAIIGVIYGAVAFIGGLNGFGPMVEPLLRVPAESYYLWMGALTPAIYLLHFLVLAGLAHLLARGVRGTGSFDDTFSVVSLTFFLPVFVTMWVFEAPALVFLSGPDVAEAGHLPYLPLWLDAGRQLVGVLWILAILIVALARVQRISLARSLAVTLAATIPAWGVTLTYLR
jgi:hypothetical protein